MASSLPPVKAAAFTFYQSLVSQADTDIFKTSVTLAAGDVKVSKDGGAFNNVATLPTEIGTSGVLSCPLSASEMDADVVVVKFSDAAGAEWQDAMVTIWTAAQTLDMTDGVVDGISAVKPDHKPTVEATGEASANVTHVKDTALTESVAGRLAAALSTLLDVATPVLTAASANQSGDAYARLGAPVGASVSADIADLPTVAEFEARTLLAADYTVVGDLPSVPTAAQNADAVWDEATAGHATAGSTGAALATAATGGDPWLTEVPSAYETGTAGAILGGLPATLANVGATVTVVSAVSGGDITVYANDTWEFTVTDATLSLSGYETIALVVKRTASQDDSDALLYLRSDTGLQRIDGAAPISAANGTLTKTATSFTGNVAISETAGVTPRSNYAWWLKGFDTTPNPDEGFTLATGKFTITPAGLQAIA